MSTVIDVRRKHMPRNVPRFKDLEIGDLFGLPGEENFVAMRTQPTGNEQLNAVVLKPVSHHHTKVQAGHHTMMQDDYEVVLVTEVSILLDNKS